MPFRLIAFLLAAFIAAPAHAASTPKAAFARLNACVKSEDPAPCRDDVTASSVELYDRFAEYDLLPCLPKNIAYVSELKNGNRTIVRGSTEWQGKPRIMRFHFAKEENQWKLDLPATLQAGLGQNWKQRVDSTEQLFLGIRHQLGSQFSCQAIVPLVK